MRSRDPDRAGSGDADSAWPGDFDGAWPGNSDRTNSAASGRVRATDGGHAGGENARRARATASGRPRPTKRGLGVAVVVALAVYMAWGYGARSLNALVVPLLVVSVAAAVSVALADRPRVERRPVAPGPVGETRTVEVVVSANRSMAATVVDAVSAGLVPLAADEGSGGRDDGTPIERGTRTERRGDAAARTDLTLSGETVVSYDVRLTERGERAVGPTTVAVTDVLGLVERRFTADVRTTVVVYPPVYGLQGRARRDLAAIADTARQHDRDEFDHLREYQRGDALRDVHWKSAAKRPADDLVVKEFVADDAFESVSIVAEAAPGCDDEMAAAAATIATYLLELGVSVAVTTPDDRREAAATDPDDDVLRLLATAGNGEVDDRLRRDADVVVRADDVGTTVRFRERTVPFERLRSGTVDGGAERSRNESRGGTTAEPSGVGT